MQLTCVTGSRKRKLKDEEVDADADIYWRINFPRFERYLRDEMVVEIIDGESSAASLRETLRALLKLCELKTDSEAASSFPISVKHHFLLRFFFVFRMQIDFYRLFLRKFLLF